MFSFKIEIFFWPTEYMIIERSKQWRDYMKKSIVLFNPIEVYLKFANNQYKTDNERQSTTEMHGNNT